jgi:hypothetical protein
MIEKLTALGPSLFDLIRSFVIGAVIMVVLVMGWWVLKTKYGLDLLEIFRRAPGLDIKKPAVHSIKYESSSLPAFQVVESDQAHVTMRVDDLVIIIRRLPPDSNK